MTGIPIRPFFAAILALASLIGGCADGDEAAGETSAPIVLAASSLQESMAAAADAWAAKGHARPVISFAASSALARQIQNGAPADLYLSADEDWMDAVEADGLLRSGSRRSLLGNEILLVAPANSDIAVDLDDVGSVVRALGDGRLAMADPDAVPAGRYGKAALESLRLWPAMKDRIARGENVRAALALVERGEAPLGIVYATDAKASDAVRVVVTFPAASHPPIRYPVAVLAASTSDDAAPFADFLASDRGHAIFAGFGFTRPR